MISSIRKIQICPEWYVEKVNSVFSLPVKALIPLFQGDIERAKNEARIIWGGVHGICLLGLTQRLSYDSDEILKTKVPFFNRELY